MSSRARSIIGWYGFTRYTLFTIRLSALSPLEVNLQQDPFLLRSSVSCGRKALVRFRVTEGNHDGLVLQCLCLSDTANLLKFVM